MLLSPIVCGPLDVIGRYYLPCVCNMADDFATVADGITTFLVLYTITWNSPIFGVIHNNTKNVAIPSATVAKSSAILQPHGK